jgi:hypothetical protein
MTTVIEELTLFLRGKGYDVSITPQEKSYNNQIIITVEDIQLEVETQNSYFMEITLKVKYITNDALNLIETFSTLPFEIEKSLMDNNELTEVLVIEILSPELERNGREYQIGINIMYKEQKII